MEKTEKIETPQEVEPVKDDSQPIQANNNGENLPNPLEVLANLAKASYKKATELGHLVYEKVRDPEFKEEVSQNAKIALDKSKEVY